MKYFYILLLLLIVHTSLFAQLDPFETTVTRNEKMNFYLYSPTPATELSPLVVFLHGGGEGGDDIELVKKHGLPKLISQGSDFPFYVFAPQNPYTNGLWDDRMIDHMVDRLVDSLSIDVKQIYLVGLSRGGNGIWRMAINNPDKYAAMISICAASIPLLYLKRTPTLPVWFFHGEKDSVVPVAQTIQAYEKMRKLNADARITLYPEANHDSWTQTFKNDEIYKWLLSHRLK